jgi:transcriptional regulator with XRE-family HTH domain
MKIDRTLLKQLRLQKAFSQEELAIAAGLSTRTVQRMEAEGSASMESQKSVAAVFGINAERLLEKTAPSPLGDPVKVIASSSLLIAATFLFTCFFIANGFAPVDSMDSRDLFVGSWAVAGVVLAILAIRELRLINSLIPRGPA